MPKILIVLSDAERDQLWDFLARQYIDPLAYPHLTALLQRIDQTRRIQDDPDPPS